LELNLNSLPEDETDFGEFDTMDLDHNLPNKGNIRDPYITKYLTSSKLMSLQLKDSTFRRHILLQMLVLFKSLATSKNAQTPFNEKQQAQIKEFAKKAKELLQKTSPNGAKFTQGVSHILHRESNWMEWKTDNCKPFERFPDVRNEKENQPAPLKRKINETNLSGKKKSEFGKFRIDAFVEFNNWRK